MYGTHLLLLLLLKPLILNLRSRKQVLSLYFFEAGCGILQKGGGPLSLRPLNPLLNELTPGCHVWLLDGVSDG